MSEHVPEDVKFQRVGQLRELIQAKPKYTGYRTDDSFLTRFLHVGKYDLDKSLKRYSAYHQCILSINGVERIRNNDTAWALDIMQQVQAAQVLKFYGFDAKQRAIVTFESGALDVNMPQVMLGTMLMNLCKMDACLEAHPEANSNGFVMVEDHAGLTMAHYKMCLSNMALMKSMMKTFDGGFPMSIKKLWIANEPAVFGLLFKVAKVFLSQKMLDRIDVISKDTAKIIDDLGGLKYAPDFLGGEATPQDLLGKESLEDRLRKVIPFNTT